VSDSDPKDRQRYPARFEIQQVFANIPVDGGILKITAWFRFLTNPRGNVQKNFGLQRNPWLNYLEVISLDQNQISRHCFVHS
jgi:hypothetical protein